MNAYLPALAGGLLIGLSAATLLLVNGRIAGISGLVAGLAQPGERRLSDLAFLLGLGLGPPLFAAMAGHWPLMRIEASWPVLAVAVSSSASARGSAPAAPPATGVRARPPVAALARGGARLPRHRHADGGAHAGGVVSGAARPLAALAAGLLFGLGLALSGMLDPARVRGFLDIGAPGIRASSSSSAGR